VIIGRFNLPLVNEGEALFHVARFDKVSAVAAHVEEFQSEQQGEPAPYMNDEPPIV
jgi:uncharacterized protein